jgi:YVTN family beta-propeller protein
MFSLISLSSAKNLSSPVMQLKKNNGIKSLVILLIIILVFIIRISPGVDAQNPPVIRPSFGTSIPVGKYPYGIAVNPNTNTIYVANTNSNTVSVIDGKTNKVTSNLTVGMFPSGIAVNPNSGIVYVADQGSNSVSVIDEYDSNDLIAGAIFHVNPSDSGHITCNGKEVPTNLYVRVKHGSTCEADVNNGFAFNSWTERLGPNSSMTITKAPKSDTLFSLFSSPTENNTFSITSFGIFDANLRDAPSPIPKEIWISLFGISLSVMIPSLLRWYNGWRQRRNLNQYMKELSSKYKSSNLKEIDQEILDLYTQGKINESQHKILRDKVVEYFDQK